MKKEVFFDPMTAAEVAERTALMDSLARQHQEHHAVLNAIFLTLARSNGCGPRDIVSLNSEKTGIWVESPDDLMPVEDSIPDEGVKSAIQDQQKIKKSQ